MARMAPVTRWASQAAQDAMLRYNPQRQALAQQIQEAGENYGNTVRASRVTAKETERSTQRAIPLLAQIFQGAKAAQGAGATLLSSDLANIPGVNPNLKAGAAQEVQQQIANSAQAGASAQALMVDRGVRAREGAQFAQTNAQQVLSRALSQLFSKGQSISGEQGAFAQSESEKLAHEAEALEQRETGSLRTAATALSGQQSTAQSAREGHETTERGSERSSATSRANAQERGAGRGKGGKGELSATAQTKAAAQLSSISNYARTLLGQGMSRGAVVERLRQGTPSVSGKTKAGNSFKTPAIPAYAPDVVLSAAIDSAASGGYVSKTTLDRLHAAGYSVSRLGLKGVKPQQTSPGGIAGDVKKALEGVF